MRRTIRRLFCRILKHDWHYSVGCDWWACPRCADAITRSQLAKLVNKSNGQREEVPTWQQQ